LQQESSTGGSSKDRSEKRILATTESAVRVSCRGRGILARRVGGESQRRKFSGRSAYRARSMEGKDVSASEITVVCAARSPLGEKTEGGPRINRRRAYSRPSEEHDETGEKKGKKTRCTWHGSLGGKKPTC